MIRESPPINADEFLVLVILQLTHIVQGNHTGRPLETGTAKRDAEIEGTTKRDVGGVVARIDTVTGLVIDIGETGKKTGVVTGTENVAIAATGLELEVTAGTVIETATATAMEVVKERIETGGENEEMIQRM